MDGRTDRGIEGKTRGRTDHILKDPSGYYLGSKQKKHCTTCKEWQITIYMENMNFHAFQIWVLADMEVVKALRI